MQNSTRPVKSDGRQPEALASLAATARHGGVRPSSIDDPVSPTGEAIPANPADKADAATKVLREGITATNQNAEKAIDALPDRAEKRSQAFPGGSG